MPAREHAAERLPAVAPSSPGAPAPYLGSWPHKQTGRVRRGHALRQSEVAPGGAAQRGSRRATV